MDFKTIKAFSWKWTKRWLIGFFLLSLLVSILNSLSWKNNLNNGQKKNSSNVMQEISPQKNINNTGTVQTNTKNTEQKPTNLANTGILLPSGDTDQSNVDLWGYIVKNQLTIITQCKSAVRGMLKSPWSADFPFASYDIKSDKGIIILKSYVDAKNAFGASIRSNFKCYLTPAWKLPTVINVELS